MRSDRYTSHANSIHPQNYINKTKTGKCILISFYQSIIYGIIMTQNRLTFSRQRKLEKGKWFYYHFKLSNFCKCPSQHLLAQSQQ